MTTINSGIDVRSLKKYDSSKAVNMYFATSRNHLPNSFFIVSNIFYMLLSLVNQHLCPSVHVGLDAVLYVAQMLVEALRHGSRLAVLAECVALARVEVVDI